MGKGNMDPGGCYLYTTSIKMVQIGQEQTKTYEYVAAMLLRIWHAAHQFIPFGEFFSFFVHGNRLPLLYKFFCTV